MDTQILSTYNSIKSELNTAIYLTVFDLQSGKWEKRQVKQKIEHTGSS